MKTGQFEHKYFTGHCKKNTGDFKKNDLIRLSNWYEGWIAELNRLVPLKNGTGKTFLEVGCGIAPVSYLLSKRNFTSFASDISSYAVRKAKKLQKNVTFFEQDITKVSKIKNKFDVIIAFEVIEHLEEPEKGIKNMIKMLKKGGVLICSTPFPCKKAYNDPTHVSVHTKYYWDRLFKKIRFKKVKSYYMTFLPFFYRISKLLSLGIRKKMTFSFVNSTLFIIAWKA